MLVPNPSQKPRSACHVYFPQRLNGCKATCHARALHYQLSVLSVIEGFKQKSLDRLLRVTTVYFRATVCDIFRHGTEEADLLILPLMILRILSELNLHKSGIRQQSLKERAKALARNRRHHTETKVSHSSDNIPMSIFVDKSLVVASSLHVSHDTIFLQ